MCKTVIFFYIFETRVENSLEEKKHILYFHLSSFPSYRYFRGVSFQVLHLRRKIHRKLQSLLSRSSVWSYVNWLHTFSSKWTLDCWFVRLLSGGVSTIFSDPATTLASSWMTWETFSGPCLCLQCLILQKIGIIVKVWGLILLSLLCWCQFSLSK